jgi:putative exosortase-associated protein (TIGR04073 family)
MRMTVSVALSLLLLVAVAVPAFAQEAPKSEAIVEKMAFKLVRGVTNVVTSIAEVPKQTQLTIRDHGNIGYVVGPLKGLGMGLYRAFIGATETVFFLVPQPGYYDPMMDPEYVWQGWEDRRPESAKTKESGQGTSAMGKGE